MAVLGALAIKAFGVAETSQQSFASVRPPFRSQ